MIKKYVVALGLLAALSISKPTLAANFIALTEPMEARIIEVIDGGNLIASTNNGAAFLRVRLIAVDPAGYNQSLTHLNNVLLGKSVMVYPDDLDSATEGRWNLAYINSDGELLNRTLLASGNGTLQSEHRFASQFATLESAEQYARARNFGIWEESNLRTDSVENAVNINTATASELRRRLEISISLANAIVDYRTYNPFNTVQEIKFVPGITKNFYDRMLNRMAVVTNINIATLEELLSLGNMSLEEAERIVTYRNTHGGFNRVDELRMSNVLPIARYNQIAEFISISNVSEVNLYVPNRLFDLNRISARQLSDLTGMTVARANTVIDNRRTYSYKTLGELIPLGAFSTQRELNRWSDNLFVQNKDTEYININTATKQDLLQLGIPSDDADLVIARQGKMHGSRTIPVDLSSWDSQISLYTNINTASEKELFSLHPNMTAALVSAIFSYRNRQVFASDAEIQQFFNGRNHGSIYDEIKNFIVVK